MVLSALLQPEFPLLLLLLILTAAHVLHGAQDPLAIADAAQAVLQHGLISTVPCSPDRLALTGQTITFCYVTCPW